MADVANPLDVALDVAAPSDAGLLANLLELYMHDLSDVFPLIEVGADGRFGYDGLPRYWSEPERRFPFLIRCGPRIVGFVLAMRGSPASDDPDVFDVAEFFVIRRHRRSGVGRRAAFLVWDRLPGRWIVRVSEGNTGALPFWAGVIAEYTGGAATVFARAGSPNDWRVFSFESPRSVAV
jgi:predicted acetyltransferase